jgi:hypothetical protein
MTHTMNNIWPRTALAKLLLTETEYRGTDIKKWFRREKWWLLATTVLAVLISAIWLVPISYYTPYVHCFCHFPLAVIGSNSGASDGSLHRDLMEEQHILHLDDYHTGMDCYPSIFVSAIVSKEAIESRSQKITMINQLERNCDPIHLPRTFDTQRYSQCATKIVGHPVIMLAE